MVEIFGLDSFDVSKFWDYVLKDIPRFFFYILDLKQYPEDCQFLIAVEREEIIGISLIWKEEIVHIRGQNEEIVKALFRAIPDELSIKVIVFEHKDKNLIPLLIPNPREVLSINRMVLEKDNMIPRFPLDKPYKKRLLTKEDAPLIAELMVKADERYWGKTKAENLVFDEAQIYTGLFDGEKLISFTLAWVDETAAIIATAATHPEYQNKGLATYLVNESVHTMMVQTEIAIIHVLIDNKPAIRVYSKVGYEVYTTHINVVL